MSKFEQGDEALQQGVRFASHNEEIEPDQVLQQVETMTGAEERPRGDLGPETQQELRNLASTLQHSRLQSKRLENFSYEPVSLPASRAPSPSSGSRTPMAFSGAPSPRPSPPTSTMHSPPLTPAATQSRDSKQSSAPASRLSQDSTIMTPEVSPPHDTPPTSLSASEEERKKPPHINVPAAPYAKHGSDTTGITSHPREPPRFTVGPSGDSLPGSKDVSPSASGTSTPGDAGTGPSTPAPQSPYMRPTLSPRGEIDDPYSRAKRMPQNRDRTSLDPRFIFGRDRDAKAKSATTPLPRSRGNGSEKEGKRHTLFHGHHHHHKKHDKHEYDDHREETADHLKEKHGSMSELKRFFKIGGHKRDKSKSRPVSPSESSGVLSAKNSKSGTRTPPSRSNTVAIPFADDHGLEARYGKFGKVLGSGAGGSVRIVKRASDGTVFAVKQFRAKHSYESDKEYTKKLTGEFCIGSTLHHGNIIETMDLVQEKSNWYVVMEYAPFDLFAIVMTGKMSREEVACCTLQILNGVSYLHSMGLAHRDLKLDNVVVNEHGIMKIIDFGSAAVFRYPFENDIVLASGIVGSDPYLAPEVYDLQKYDPQPTDIWSIAIIFCCMTLRRFPWKAPRTSDNSFKLFVSPPNTNDWPQHTSRKSSEMHGPSHSALDVKEHGHDHGSRRAIESAPASRMPSQVDPKDTSQNNHHHANGDGQGDRPTTAGGNAQNAPPSRNGKDTSTAPQAQQTIKGPWRLLRLLPRESRHIIGRMLEIDPKKRATLEEIMDDKWVKATPVCQQLEGGKIVAADNHTHTLEPGSATAVAATPAPSHKK
ncbi:Hal protein kinase [Lasiodiplodia theobromae]|uniref:non-specific serine/threonine protein kinase n=1 Tax=Lasiodiplodia theobromae TaxID=45133 RepID=A0A5N5DLI8_9PEZI|nr:Hal protein kinase [Lasiodiplodia theobromae]KAB2578788.1 Serine/threonine-protein kinase oca2 [Lasiodiplodia theobromae]KAF4535300.1 Hal protein kinase [Lasiodiplodia theobromae]